METQELLFALVSLIFVISLIGICAFVIKRYILEGKFFSGMAGNPKDKRLKVLEHMPLDSKRRLMLIEKDGEEILLLLGTTDAKIISTSAVKKK